MLRQIKGAHPIRHVSQSDRERLSRIMARCRRQGECLLWPNYTDPDGYGQTWFEKRAAWAHRVIYAAFVGPLEWFEEVHHTCYNPSCVNPNHLSKCRKQEHNNDHAPTDESF